MMPVQTQMELPLAITTATFGGVALTHCACIGAVGTGKTHTLRALLRERLAQGVSALMLDPYAAQNYAPKVQLNTPDCTADDNVDSIKSAYQSQRM